MTVSPPKAAPDAWSSLLEHWPEAGLLVDAAGGIVAWNAAADRWLELGADPARRFAHRIGLEPQRLETAEPSTLDAIIGHGIPTLRWCRVGIGARVDGLRFVSLVVLPQAFGAETRDAGLTAQLLDAALKLGQVGYWRVDRASGRATLNEAAAHLLGLPPRPEGFAHRELDALVAEDDRATVRAASLRAIETGQPQDYDVRMRRSDGELAMMRTRRFIERDAKGEPTIFHGITVDVSGLHEDARRAREWLERFDLLAESTRLGYWSIAGGAERATWSRQMAAFHGLRPEDPVPTPQEWIAHYVHPDDQGRVHRAMVEWVAAGTPAFSQEYRVVRRDGSIAHLVMHAHRRTSDERGQIFGLVLDLTAERVAELALRERNARASLAASAAGVGTWEYLPELKQHVWDEQMWRLRGRTPGNTEDRDALIACVHPDDRERVTVHGRAAEDRPFDYEFRVVWPDGTVRWLASRSTSLYDEQGKLLSRVGINWDVTDARAAASERAERLAAQREVQAKSRFLSRMSHELRTPLNAVLGFTELMLREDGMSDAATRERRLEHVRVAGAHLLTLINDVLDLSKLEGGEMPVVLDAVSLARVWASVRPMVDELASERAIRIEPDTLPPVAVQADATRLRQVLLNLLTNAIKYNRAGGSVQVGVQVAGDGVELVVADTGIGLDAAQLARLFEPFNRLGAERHGIAGTGIGLAIVKALVERMGGRVRAESVPGEGTRMIVQLAAASPLAAAGDAATSVIPQPSGSRAPHAEPSAALRAAARHGGTRRGVVLYIEDNPVNATIVQELMARRPSLRLVMASDGQSGFEAARVHRPDLVLLDLQLPDIDGLEVYRSMRADPLTADVPVVALSANAMPSDIERTLALGFADYWTKPLDFGVFFASLDLMFGAPV